VKVTLEELNVDPGGGLSITAAARALPAATNRKITGKIRFIS
jgi:hypothetical protein